MRTGVLCYDGFQDRIDVRFGNDDRFGGLHCGQKLAVEIDGVWVPTRIEFSWANEAWYLVGIDPGLSLLGLRVRI